MKKSAQIANFNVVFGQGERPMLDFFDTIIYPAFVSGISRSSGENEYLFKNVEIQNNNENYVLTGKIVKKTVLEIKSDLDSKGELIEKDEKYSSAPYSSFVINLLNHRMIFMLNQKGSPTLSSFRSTVSYVIEEYIKQINKDLDENEKYEFAITNVVGIPSARSMDELLENVEKVNKLTLKFFPLNGDMDYSEAFGLMANDVRKELNCKTGSIVFNSPKSIDGIKRILEKAAGTIEPVINVVTKSKSKATLKDYEMSEKYDIEVQENDSFDKETEQLINKTSTINTLKFSNDKHVEIYMKNKGKIEKIISEKR